jgi:threonine dehydratase
MVATAMGAKALVLMAKNVAPFNIELTKQMGGEVELCEDAIEAFAKADGLRRQGHDQHPFL